MPNYFSSMALPCPPMSFVEKRAALATATVLFAGGLQAIGPFKTWRQHCSGREESPLGVGSERAWKAKAVRSGVVELCYFLAYSNFGKLLMTSLVAPGKISLSPSSLKWPIGMAT